MQEVTHYLVKWCSLPYEESTWELEEDVDPGKIREFESLQIPPEIKSLVSKASEGRMREVTLSQLTTHLGLYCHCLLSGAQVAHPFYFSVYFFRKLCSQKHVLLVLSESCPSAAAVEL